MAAVPGIPMHLAGCDVVVLATREIAVAEAWLKQHVLNTLRRTIGFDTESYAPRVRGRSNELALLQFTVRPAGGGPLQVLLFHVHKLCEEEPTWMRRAESLKFLLQSDAISKCAVDIRGDVRQLNKFGQIAFDQDMFHCSGFVDLQKHPAVEALSLGSRNRLSTDRLVQYFLPSVSLLPKDKSVRMSPWNTWPLDQKQEQYAAQDAVIALRLHEAMETKVKIEHVDDDRVAVKVEEQAEAAVKIENDDAPVQHVHALYLPPGSVLSCFPLQPAMAVDDAPIAPSSSSAGLPFVRTDILGPNHAPAALGVIGDEAHAIRMSRNTSVDLVVPFRMARKKNLVRTSQTKRVLLYGRQYRLRKYMPMRVGFPLSGLAARSSSSSSRSRRLAVWAPTSKASRLTQPVLGARGMQKLRLLLRKTRALVAP